MFQGTSRGLFRTAFAPPDRVRRRRFRPGPETLEGRALLSRVLEVCNTNPEPGDYPTIQSAVIAAQPGDKIEVCPGTYPESVKVPATKSNLVIESQSTYKATVNSFDIQGARGIAIVGFTVVGPNVSGTYPNFAGIEVDDGSSAAILRNHVTDSFDQTGIGVVSHTASDSTNVLIASNTVDNYLGKNSGSPTAGIFVGGAGVSAAVTQNTVIGNGPISSVAQNGIEIAQGASAQVDHNTVSKNIYTPGTFAAAGIILFDSGRVQVDHNTLTSNDVGILSMGETGHIIVGVVIDHNTISRSTYDGIELYYTKNAQVSHNDSSDNTMDGIYVDASSVQNTISHNRFRHNGAFDIEDRSHGTGTAGTANYYDHNDCMTSSPPGLCDSQKGGKDSGGDEGNHSGGDQGNND